ncbi:MAG TPA: hypothetical protein VGF83_05120 [Actinomycetota bacterium]
MTARLRELPILLLALLGLMAFVLAGLAQAGCAHLSAQQALACVPPTAAEAAAKFADCEAQPGADAAECALQAAWALGDYLRCLEAAHATGRCDRTSCPYPHGDR